MKCKNCGAETPSEKSVCIYCGSELPKPPQPNQNIVQNITYNVTNINNSEATPDCRPTAPMMMVSPKSKGAAIALCCCGFLGLGGLNRFYVGKKASGIVYLLTFGLFWIGTIYDLIQLKNGRFKDSNGLPLR